MALSSYLLLMMTCSFLGFSTCQPTTSTEIESSSATPTSQTTAIDCGWLAQPFNYTYGILFWSTTSEYHGQCCNDASVTYLNAYDATWREKSGNDGKKWEYVSELKKIGACESSTTAASSTTTAITTESSATGSTESSADCEWLASDYNITLSDGSVHEYHGECCTANALAALSADGLGINTNNVDAQKKRIKWLLERGACDDDSSTTTTTTSSSSSSSSSTTHSTSKATSSSTSEASSPATTTMGSSSTEKSSSTQSVSSSDFSTSSVSPSFTSSTSHSSTETSSSASTATSYSSSIDASTDHTLTPSSTSTVTSTTTLGDTDSPKESTGSSVSTLPTSSSTSDSPSDSTTSEPSTVFEKTSTSSPASSSKSTDLQSTSSGPTMSTSSESTSSTPSESTSSTSSESKSSTSSEFTSSTPPTTPSGSADSPTSSDATGTTSTGTSSTSTSSSQPTETPTSSKSTEGTSFSVSEETTSSGSTGSTSSTSSEAPSVGTSSSSTSSATPASSESTTSSATLLASSSSTIHTSTSHTSSGTTASSVTSSATSTSSITSDSLSTSTETSSSSETSSIGTTVQSTSSGTTTDVDGVYFRNTTVQLFPNCTQKTVELQFFTNGTVLRNTTVDLQACTSTTQPTTESTRQTTTAFAWPTGGTTRVLPSGEILLSEALIAYKNCTTELRQLIYNPATNTTRTEVTVDGEGCKKTSTLSSLGSFGTTTPMPSPDSSASTTPVSFRTTTFSWPTGGTTRTLPNGEILISEALVGFKNCTTMLMQLIWNPSTNITRTAVTTDTEGCKHVSSTTPATPASGSSSSASSSTTTSSPDAPVTFPQSLTTRVLPSGEIILSEALVGYGNCTTVLYQQIWNPQTNKTRVATVTDANGCKATSTTTPTTPTKKKSTKKATTRKPGCAVRKLDLSHTIRPTKQEQKKTWYQVGEALHHQCERRYVMNMARQPWRVYYCQHDGSWSGALQYCEKEREL